MRINEIESTKSSAIKQLLKKYFITPDKVTIDSNGLVNSDDSVILIDGTGVREIPVRFNRVEGNFMCRNNQLITLEGSPVFVGGKFDCDDNQITSLKGSPQTIGSYFTASNNKLTSLDRGPISVGGNYYCDHNKLTSLHGMAPTIGGDVHCGNNYLTNLEGSPPVINGSFRCTDNPLTSLLGIPQTIEEILYITYKPNLPLMRALVADGIYFHSEVESTNYALNNAILEVLNKYAGQGKSAMMKCSSELLTLGKELGLDLRQNARW